MLFEDTIITDEIDQQLSQGKRIDFKWYGNIDLVYQGRIEVNDLNYKYFVNEFDYENDKLINEQFRFYNLLESFGKFVYIYIYED
jgi:hypothetical protein